MLVTHNPKKESTDKSIFINRNIPNEAIDLLTTAGFRLLVWEGDQVLPNDEINELLKDCDAFLSTGAITITPQLLQDKPKLKIVSQASAGYNNIAIEEASSLNICVANAPGTMNKATADIAFTLMLNASRKMFYMNQLIKEGKWEAFKFTDFLGQELHGKTLGVFGLGNIGYEMAKLCKAAYNMDIIYHNRSKNEQAETTLDANYVSFDELVEKSDVISVHCNLTTETKGVFNKEIFSKMKPTSIFINVARGGVHVEEDLIEALQTNSIWGAGLDVTNPEPMEKDNPLLFMENVAVTPHIGSATTTARTAMAMLAAQNIIDFFEGKSLSTKVN
ncbi:2-hydroxyacid dehydrogenase [Neptunitalea lumnitzerae]|uniref:Bifunctional glyoxylate/hydroxypyruvate reductase B n=1 Tax=Neptunitalea lumnitzerae TaxID=2965509 RepID=A0ABQ5MHP3_9FLAO|nr:D-glycerate dehydrogenase [Neptunitalea sp. Y10]GLB48909.1 bifunctional glyoxylate/hydroxypyruvate reductase B [Neptunitalea sp. Y10]